jgi:hypothetical protein
MYEFILGTIFGAGLVLAIQTISREWNAFNQRRWIASTNETIALLDEPEVDTLNPDLATWGWVEPTDAGPCGCHATWTEHYTGWDYTCKCHRTRADHEAGLPVNHHRRPASTPDTDWAK